MFLVSPVGLVLVGKTLAEQDLLLIRQPFRYAGATILFARNIANCRNVGQLNFG
jgi:hypothetical protein